MTYHALENRMRKWKKEATALKDESGGGESVAKIPAKPRAKKASASPIKGGKFCILPNASVALLTECTAVKTGRVTKKKAPAAPKIKPEPVNEEDDLLDYIVEEETVDSDEAVGETDEFI
jgi:hypothetical protein